MTTEDQEIDQDHRLSMLQDARLDAMTPDRQCFECQKDLSMGEIEMEREQGDGLCDKCRNEIIEEPIEL